MLRDLDNLKATATRKGLTLDAWEEHNESTAGKLNFELGCWLYYYNRRIYDADGFNARVDCMRRIFEAGHTYLHYEYFTVFDFGERQFDTLIEMGDASEVIDAVRTLYLPVDTSGNVRTAFEYFGWPLVA